MNTLCDSLILVMNSFLNAVGHQHSCSRKHFDRGLLFCEKKSARSLSPNFNMGRDNKVISLILTTVKCDQQCGMTKYVNEGNLHDFVHVCFCYGFPAISARQQIVYSYSF